MVVEHEPCGECCVCMNKPWRWCWTCGECDLCTEVSPDGGAGLTAAVGVWTLRRSVLQAVQDLSFPHITVSHQQELQQVVVALHWAALRAHPAHIRATRSSKPPRAPRCSPCGIKLTKFIQDQQRPSQLLQLAYISFTLPFCLLFTYYF